MTARRVPTWPVYLLALPAAVAIWAGWVGLGGLTGFGVVQVLPGIVAGARINTAITLPIGMEAYAAFALRAWLTPATPARARRFARSSAIGALVLGATGQVAYHLMVAAQVTTAPWPITAVVACLPVAVLGMGATLAHLLAQDDDTAAGVAPTVDVTAVDPPADPLIDQVAAMVATARAGGRPIGRRTVARELGVTEHRAGQLLAVINKGAA